MLIHPTYQETYRSTSGAEGESQKVFVDPMFHFAKKQKMKHFSVFEFGLGFGVNLQETIQELSKSQMTCDYYVLENDSFTLNHPDQNELNTLLINYKNISFDYINIFLIKNFEDIKNLPSNFDFFFHDPFSVKVNSDAWTLDVFKTYYKKSNENSMIFTYSASRKVRINLLMAGFRVLPVEGFGRKKESTFAFKNPDFIPPWKDFENKYSS